MPTRSYMPFNLDSKFAVVDVETTGQSARNGYIIEVGIVFIDHRRIIGTYQTLIRPPVSIPYFITMLTGIRDADVYDAPDFQSVSDELLHRLEGYYFVAHNASFDYSFFKSEFERMNRHFYMDKFCTVRLGRKFFPELKKYNLDRMMEYFGIRIDNRHRALGDALATAEIFIRYLNHPNALEVFSAYAATFDKKNLWKERLELQIMDLPEAKGVYIFKDHYDLPLYIGKSKNIRGRIMSHLRDDHLSKKKRLWHSTDHFDWIECGTELEALILESRLIKKYMPPYNVQQKKWKEYFYVKVTKDSYPLVLTTTDKNSDGAEYIGPFRSSKLLEYLLIRLQKHFKLCPELFRERRTKKGVCFSYHLQQCTGACGELISPDDYRRQVNDAMRILKDMTDMESEENIRVYLSSPDLWEDKYYYVRKGLKNTYEQLKEDPALFREKYFIFDTQDQTGYFIQYGVLRKILTGDELEDRNLLRELFLSEPVDIPDDKEALDERLTIRRFVRMNRERLKIVEAV